MSNIDQPYPHFVLPALSKEKRIKAYKKHIRTNPKLVLDDKGELLTDDHYFDGRLRPPTGMKTKGARANSNPHFAVHALIVKDIKLLSADAQTWNDTAYKTVAEQLYGILARVYTLHKTIVNTEKNVKAVRDAIWDFAVNKQNLIVKSSTSNIGLLVSCVFKSVPAQRRSAYGLGLLALITNFGPNLSEAEVVQHIIDAGGIYELANPEKDPKPDAATKVAQKNQEVEALASKLHSNVLTTFENPIFAALLSEPNKPYLAIITKNDAGQIDIRALCDSDADIINATKASFVEQNEPPKKPKKGDQVKKLTEVFAGFINDPAYTNAA